MSDETRSELVNEKLPVASHNNERLTMFSDGVFAITITLLVLEIKVPDIAANLVATELPKELLHLVPKFIGHILSFIVLGLYWIAHHNMFIHIKRHDHVLLWLNTLFLLCVASIPFPTGLLGHYPDQQVSVIAYAGTLFLTGVFLNVIWWYATTHQLVDDTLEPQFIAFVHRYIRVAPALYLVSIAVSFLSLPLAKILFVAVAIVYIIPNPYHRKYYKQLARRFEQ
ncbi:MAG: DUF1211 domain-containing protein [Tildeniella nuda ZEHNDER 1965/U140]|jgi:uncharacterized membrane protein|nr:DUF1211 domain-containing protein [Tildeniella nuda ZEHNDER 1965/U140]